MYDKTMKIKIAAHNCLRSHIIEVKGTVLAMNDTQQVFYVCYIVFKIVAKLCKICELKRHESPTAIPTFNLATPFFQ
jgi:hypothetical protein